MTFVAKYSWYVAIKNDKKLLRQICKKMSLEPKLDKLLELTSETDKTA